MSDPAAVLRDWLARRGLTAQFRETHASVVAIAGDRVYKMKKPVRYPFLDLSTSALRKRVCEREVELNRRLAPDVYVGIVAVTDPDGRVVDHAVEMVRLPDDHRLDQLLDRPAAGICLARLAELMAQFHDRGDRSAPNSSTSSAKAVAELWQASFDGIREFVGPVLDPATAAEVEHLARRYVAGRALLFELRAEHEVDGHGDLRADDVFCLPDGLRVIDCLEFDDRLRWGDALADVAFLAMDLEWLRHPGLAGQFLEEYRTAAQDEWPQSLEHHWIAYRAHVRAKVACLRVEAGAPGRDSATGHLALALRHLRAAQVRLVLIGGLPGTGKSTLAAGLADRLGWTVLRSDVVRRDAVGSGTTEQRYSEAAKDRVYDELMQRAADLLQRGEHVVLDASWSRAGPRRAAAELADRAGAELIALRCVAPAEVTDSRIRSRMRQGTDESEADVDVARSMAFDPWPEALPLDTSASPSTVVQHAAALLVTRDEGPGSPPGTRSRLE